MNICITGACGHIGSHLIRNLAIPNLDKVFLVDNLLTQRYASLFDLPQNTAFRFYELDILSKEIEPIIKDSDVVVHLAAITNAEASFHNRDLVENVNKEGTEFVARLCARYHRSIIFPSSTSVYGSQSELVDETCPEEDLKPQSPYADSKIYAEKLFVQLAKTDNLKFMVMRLGTIFGYSIGMRFHTAVNKFSWQAAVGDEISVWKTALKQKRPYCGLNDCINAINYCISEQLFDGQIYNIVTLNLTVEDILATIRESIPDIKITFVDSPIMNQLSYHVSSKKSLNRGFTYCDNLKDCIDGTIKKLSAINYSVKKNT